MEINDIEVTDYQVLKNREMSQKVLIETIEKIVCNYYNIGFLDIANRSRKREIVEKRFIFQYLASKYTRETLGSIGRYNGGTFHHSTVIHAVHKVRDLIDTEKPFKAVIDDLEKQVKEVQLIILGEREFKEHKLNLYRSLSKCDTYRELQLYFLKNIIKK